MWLSISCIKIIQLLSKTGKVAANDGESNGFFKKMLETILTNNSFIQGGDGGMEYAMCTLMLGNGTLEGIFGTATHELGHSWFQHVLASNESNILGWMKVSQPIFLILQKMSFQIKK
jgi:hypothetical protein